MKGWKRAAAIAALAIGLASPLAAIAETAGTQGQANQGAANQGAAALSDNNVLYSRLPKLADHAAKAEQYFQKGDHARGLTYILPYVFAGNMQRGKMAGEVVKALLIRYPDAMAAFKNDLYVRVQDFRIEADAVAVSRLADWAFLEGILGLTEHRSLQKSIAVRARNPKNFRWDRQFLLSDPYEEVPGLTDSDAEEEIFERSISQIKESDYRNVDRSEANYLAFRILAYASAHRNDAEVVRTVLNEWPNFKISVAFRRTVEERYPFIAQWRESPDDLLHLNLRIQSIRIQGLTIR